MAINVVRRGRVLEIPVVAGSVTGDPYMFGQFSGFLLTSRDTDGNAECDFGRNLVVIDTPVEGRDGGGNSPVAVADDLYYDVLDTPPVSKDNSGEYYGAPLETVAGGATTTIEVITKG